MDEIVSVSSDEPRWAYAFDASGMLLWMGQLKGPEPVTVDCDFSRVKKISVDDVQKRISRLKLGGSCMFIWVDYSREESGDGSESKPFNNYGDASQLAVDRAAAGEVVIIGDDRFFKDTT